HSQLTTSPILTTSTILTFFLTPQPTTEIYTLSLHDVLPICVRGALGTIRSPGTPVLPRRAAARARGTARSPARRTRNRSRQAIRSEEHTSELQSRGDLVCRLLHEKKKDEKGCFMFGGIR